MNALKRLLEKADATPAAPPVAAVRVATWKKFGDDEAGNLAALIAYYAFASIFPAAPGPVHGAGPGPEEQPAAPGPAGGTRP